MSIPVITIDGPSGSGKEPSVNVLLVYLDFISWIAVLYTV